MITFLGSCSLPRLMSESGRGPSSLLKYPEFSFDRNFFFNEENCRNSNPPFLTRRDYEFEEFKQETGITYYASREKIKERFDSLFSSRRRLRNRLFLDQDLGQFVLPHSSENLRVSTSFLNFLAHHFEEAMRMNVIEFFYYPDFGHAHLYIPSNEAKRSIEEQLANPQLKIVYHTAEKLMMKNGRQERDSHEYRQFRYRTRNLVGGFDERGSLEVHYAHKNQKFNTLHEIPGTQDYIKTGGSLYMSASKNGCIGYLHDGKKKYFDISFSH
jgi:hypothetical protein